MSRRSRFSKAMQQEQLSRHQLEACFVEVGWLASEPPDLGEDFLFSMYFKGSATGVAFYVQLKSITNLYARKTRGSLSYPLEVKDLIHWHSFALPVVLIVWDVELKEGRWAFVPQLISDLDGRRPQWRQQKKASVHLPWINTTDKQGLSRLRSSIGHLMYPMIAKSRPLSIQVDFRFDSTPEGRAAWEAWERLQKEGEPATFKGQTIQDIRFSEWWQPWVEAYDPDKVELTFGPACSSDTHMVAVDIIPNDGMTASVSNVELKTVRAGTEVMQLSNKHQSVPFHFNLRVDRRNRLAQITVSIGDESPGHNVRETRRILEFQRAMSVGGKLVVTFLESLPASLTGDAKPIPSWAPDVKLMDIVKKLCTIQDRTGKPLRLPIKGILPQDVTAIEELLDIIEHGRTVRKRKGTIWTIKIDSPQAILDLYKPGSRILGRQSFYESYVDLLGTRIPTGPMTRQTTATLDLSYCELQAAISTLAPGEPLTVKIPDPEIVESFDEWRIGNGQS